MADSTISNLPTSTSPSAATYAPIEDTLVNYKITLPNLVLAGGGVIINAASQQTGYINISSYLRSGSSFFYPTSLVMLGTGTFGTGQKASLYDDGTNAIFQAATGGAAYLYANAGASSNNLKLDTSNNATLSGSGAFKTGSSVYGATSATVNGSLALAGAITGATTGSFAGVLTALSFTGSGAGLTAATVPNAALVTTPVTSVTASGNLSSSGGTTPAITLTANPSFTSVTISTALALSSGGTGSTTKNFVDLSTAQTVAGIKTFSSAPVMSGASITAGTVSIGAGGAQTGTLPLANGGTGAISLAASPFVVLSPASQQTGTVNTSGNHITGGSFVAGSTQINATSIVLSNGATSVSIDYSVTNNGLVTFSKQLAMNSLPYSFQRNKIINGGMAIDQRNNGASGTTVNAYTVDRWTYVANQSGKLSWGQHVAVNSASEWCLGFTSLSSYSPASSDYFEISQYLEAENCRDTLFGTSAAQPITVSFYVYSSLTGTFGACITNYAFTRFYPFTYSIPVANTWTYCTVTVPGDVTGTWALSGNSGSICFRFDLGSGTAVAGGTAGSWSSSTSSLFPSGCVKLVSTNAATWYMTGAQIETGSQATPFEQRLYGTELALCQRYFYTLWNSLDIGASLQQIYGAAYWLGTTQAIIHATFPVPMRTGPTFTYTGSISAFSIFAGGSAITPTALAQYYASNTKNAGLLATVASSGASGDAGYLTMTASNTGALQFSAEL